MSVGFRYITDFQQDNLLNVLYEIASVICRSYGQSQMLQDVILVLQERLRMQHGTIMLLSQDGDELHVEAMGESHHSAKNDVKYRKGEGITGKVLQSGDPAIVERIADEPSFCGRIHDRGGSGTDYSFVCVPVLLGSETVGTLAVDIIQSAMDDLRRYQKLLSIVASMIANDVKNRRMSKLERRALTEENFRLRNELKANLRPENMKGSSTKMRSVYQKIYQVAPSETSVLIRGESGTGKELVASAIHYNSNRSDGPFIKLNCAALSENLLESELFGHEKGSFTGAVAARKGRIEQAQGGTLFLDEIGDFSPAIQIKLLRVLQEREFEPVGSNNTIKADVRIIAATNRDLEEGLKNGSFRLDLYYRINVFPVHLPPLRERKEDLLILADHFVQQFALKMDKPIRRISTTAINMIMSYHWPGNIRELENCIEYAILMSEDGVIHAYNLPPSLQSPLQSGSVSSGSLKAAICLLERDMIIDSLKRNNGKVIPCSDELGITSRMLRYKIKNLKIDYQKYLKPKK